MNSASENAQDNLLETICAIYDNSKYPQGFLEAYDIMECLGESPGCDTFLVQDSSENLFIAKCYDQSIWDLGNDDDILKSLDHPNLPKHVARFKNEYTTVIVRTFIEGVPLDRYARSTDLDEQDIVSICIKLCDVIAYLHHRESPIIHRDIKPANVIVRPDSFIALIDFDIARVYRAESETDTRFFGTIAYAPPEQYGFAQTDERADIYSLGVLLRYLLTGSPRENRNVHVYRPLEKIIAKCTAFDPAKRYADIDQVKHALSSANPRSQSIRIAGILTASLVVICLLAFAGVQIYKAATWSPFNSDAIPAVLNDEERIDDAIMYLKDKYSTDLFNDADDLATVGLLRKALIELYGLDRDYVYSYQEEGLPGESDKYFMAWGWDDDQAVRKETAVYAAVKAHDPSIVAEDQWSKLPDDNGEYPGARVAMLFADEAGITTGVNRPYDITKGELALIFANADRVFDTAK